MYERMLDKQAEPTADEMAAYCGSNGERFARLNCWLSEEYGTERELSFPYGNSYGWGVTHRKKKKLICHVFAEDGAFTVMLRLTNKQFESVYDGLRPYARAYVDGKYPCGDGGWIHYRVTGEEHFQDLQTLLSAKCADC